MISSFSGIEVAKRALQTNQAALSTINHNISNANTKGYTRQRVNMTQTAPFPSVGIDQPKIKGQLGTGVTTGSITRIRDSFVDMQYRTETSKLGYWNAKAEMLSQMETIMNEPSDTGINATMDQFWNSLQDLSVNPQNDGARRVVRERGVALASTFTYSHQSLKAIQKDYRNEIDVTQTEVNSILRSINELNKQIGSLEPHGFVTNDLYDKRDVLIDELSTIMNIKVEHRNSGGLAAAEAEGIVDVFLATPEGDVLRDSDGRHIKLVDAAAKTAYGMHVTYENRQASDSPFSGIKFFELDSISGFKNMTTTSQADTNTDTIFNITSFEDFKTDGALKGYIEGYGYNSKAGELKGIYNDMLADLDTMVFTFANHFNQVHQAGWSLNEIFSGEHSDVGLFFDLGAATSTDYDGIAGKIKVHQDILDDVQNIAAAAEGNVLAGSMEREKDANGVSTVSTGIAGNPSFSGIFDGAAFPNATDIKLDLQYTPGTKASPDGATVAVPGKWQYQLSDADGVAGGYVDLNVNDKGVAIVDGVSIDVRSILNLPVRDFGATAAPKLENWTITFPKDGFSPKDSAFVGNGSNALALANVKDQALSFGGNLSNVQTFYQGVIGKMGDMSRESIKMTETAQVLQNSVDTRRQSITSVSLDEEMANMVQFQHAYNAAARVLTSLDECLDKIINGMGVVGR